MTSESTRFFGQPNEIKPTVGAVGWGTLLTYLFYRESGFATDRKGMSDAGARLTWRVWKN